jgi:hypothetical protein
MNRTNSVTHFADGVKNNEDGKAEVDIEIVIILAAPVQHTMTITMEAELPERRTISVMIPSRDSSIHLIQHSSHDGNYHFHYFSLSWSCSLVMAELYAALYPFLYKYLGSVKNLALAG